LDIAITWFNNIPDENLLIIWSGDAKDTLEKWISWENIIFTWPQYWDDLVNLVQHSQWLIFPWEEDFWIVPIEVMAAGKPVFALRAGWLLETVLEWKTWEFFDNPDGSDFVEKFIQFNTNNLKNKYSPEDCKIQAELFSDKVFENTLQSLIKN
jgi:glycosyltransferase involved in cell wall biosynthesis